MELKNIEKSGKFRTNPSDRRTYIAYLFLHVATRSKNVLLFPQISAYFPSHPFILLGGGNTLWNTLLDCKQSLIRFRSAPFPLARALFSHDYS